MKLNITIEATPKELREFLGLPDVQPLQDEMMQLMRENMLKGGAGFDPAALMKPLMTGPLSAQNVEALQKLFWDAFRKAMPTMASPVKSEDGKGDGG